MPSIRTVALSGIGGYGEVYGKALLEEGESHGLTLTGCIDPYPGLLLLSRGAARPPYSGLRVAGRLLSGAGGGSPLHFRPHPPPCGANLPGPGPRQPCALRKAPVRHPGGGRKHGGGPPRRRSGGGHRVSVRLQPGHPCFAGGHLAGDVRRAPAVQGHVPAASGQRLLPAGLGGPCPGGRPYRLRQRGQ